MRKKGATPRTGATWLRKVCAHETEINPGNQIAQSPNPPSRWRTGRLVK